MKFKRCKLERKQAKKHDAWNRKHYGKKLANMYHKLSKIERKLSRMMCLRTKRTDPLDEGLMKQYEDYYDKCWRALPDKCFWRGDYYHM